MILDHNARKRLFALAACVFFGLGLPSALGQNEPAEDPARQTIEQRITELEHALEELKGASSQASTEEAEKPTEEEEFAELRALAAEATGETPEDREKTPPEETVFSFKGLNLQRLNPEISVSVDLVGSYLEQKDVRKKFDVDLRAFEFNVQSYLDPFSRMKSTVAVDGEGDIVVEEAYFTRFSVFGQMNLHLGRFRQQFGVINRWHGDALDQVEYPLPLQYIFGEEGLFQTGLSTDVTLPAWGDAAQELTFQVTAPENEQLFEGETLGTPALLCHYKNFRDVTRDTYVELGLSGLLGWKDAWDVLDGGVLQTDHDALPSVVFGADLTLVWEPADRSLYRNVEWRTEFMGLHRELLAPDGSGRDSLLAWGAFTYVQSKVAQTFDMGVRFDFYKPDTQDYAEDYPGIIRPFAVGSRTAHVWQVAPYVTWWQSEFVRFRLEYNHVNGHGLRAPAHAVLLQVVFAAGPHKHERY